MKKLLSVMLLALLLTGCGGEEKTTTICKGNIDEMTAAEVTIEATGDKTDVMKSTVTYDFTGYVTESTPIDTYWLPKVKSINVDYDSLKGGSAKYLSLIHISMKVLVMQLNSISIMDLVAYGLSLIHI